MTFFPCFGVYSFRGDDFPMEASVVYIDILFILNFIIDGVCLALSLSLAGKPFLPWRLLLSCTVGGVYAVVAVLLEALPFGMQVALHLGVGFLLCAIALKKPTLKGTVPFVGLFVLCNALLGGVLTLLYSLCGKYALYRGVFYAELSAWSVIILGVVAGSACLLAICRYRQKSRSSYADVIITYNGKTSRLFCLCDSGSLLRCPYTGLPVMTVKPHAVEALCSESTRYIPVKSLGGDCLLPSFVPDSARIRMFGKREFRELRLCVAVDTAKNDFGGCDGLLPSVLF